MTKEIQAWLKLMRETHPLEPGRVLEIGSKNVNGSPRFHFQDAQEYVGIDSEGGPGVDRVLHGEKALREFGVDSFDTVICTEVLEHDLAFFTTVFGIHAMLKAGGHFFVSTPTFGFPLHRFPKDYYRFGEDTYREMFFWRMQILDLRHLDEFQAGQGVTLAGLAKKLDA